MRDVAKACYEKCAVGSVGFIKPDFALGETLASFQVVLSVSNVMQENGQIHIQEVHRESHTGHHYVDFIKFLRIK